MIVVAFVALYLLDLKGNKDRETKEEGAGEQEYSRRNAVCDKQHTFKRIKKICYNNSPTPKNDHKQLECLLPSGTHTCDHQALCAAFQQHILAGLPPTFDPHQFAYR